MVVFATISILVTIGLALVVAGVAGQVEDGEL